MEDSTTPAGAITNVNILDLPVLLLGTVGV